MTKVQLPAQWAGRLLLVGAVAFWWSVAVAPRLISLVHPEWIGPRAIPLWANPDSEASIANAVSAAALATTAMLAFGNAVATFRRREGRIAVAGWAALGLLTGVGAVEEVFELKAWLAVIAEYFGYPALWPLVPAPVAVPCLLVVGLFVRKSLHSWSVRVPIVLGLFTWIFALWLDMARPIFLADRASDVGILLEETLEFSGTLLIGFGAAIALQGSMESGRRVFGGRWRGALVASVVAVAVHGGFVGLFAFRAPILDLRGAHVYQLSLPDQWSAVQELRMPATPIGQISIRTSLGQPIDGRSRSVTWRVLRGGASGEILREGKMEVSARRKFSQNVIDLSPPLAQPEGEPVALQIVADVGPPATNSQSWHGLKLLAVKGHSLTNAQLRINGEPAWPDQAIEFVAYSAPEPTWTKMQAVWRIVTTDWRWTLLVGNLAAAFTLITFVPIVLVAAALPARPRRRGGASGA